MSHGLVEAQRVLLRLVEKGMLREDAYDMVQSMAMESHGPTAAPIARSSGRIPGSGTDDQSGADSCFELKTHLTHVDTIFRRLGLLKPIEEERRHAY